MLLEGGKGLQKNLKDLGSHALLIRVEMEISCQDQFEENILIEIASCNINEWQEDGWSI